MDIYGHGVPRSFAAGDVVLSCEPWVVAFEYQQYMKVCAYCFQDSDKLMRCSSCKLHHYCGTECQLADWKKSHHSECKMLEEMHSAVRLIWEQKPHIQKDYHGEFGFCTAEFLLAKIDKKIQSGKKSEVGAQDVLDMLPYDQRYENLFKESDCTLHSRIWPNEFLGSIPTDFDQLARKVYYNALPIRQQMGKEILTGAGLFPRTLHRQMTPVRWGINVTMDLQGRNLVVRATQDIVNFTGLKDLRLNKLAMAVNIFARQRSGQQVRQLYPDRAAPTMQAKRILGAVQVKKEDYHILQVVVDQSAFWQKIILEPAMGIHVVSHKKIKPEDKYYLHTASTVFLFGSLYHEELVNFEAAVKTIFKDQAANKELHITHVDGNIRQTGEFDAPMIRKIVYEWKALKEGGMRWYETELEKLSKGNKGLSHQVPHAGGPKDPEAGTMPKTRKFIRPGVLGKESSRSPSPAPL